MNDHEAQRIAAATNQLRPDWPTRSLLTLISKHLIDRPRRDVMVALAWVACENGTSNPGRVLEAGPWWLAAGVAGDTTGRREQYDPAKFCAVCSKPNDQRHPQDHPFESALGHTRALAHDDQARRTSARELVREYVGDAQAEREPPPEPQPATPSPDVDRLRDAMTAPPPDREPETAPTEETP